MKLVYWTSDGAGNSGGREARVMNQWIRTNGDPSLIIYGGDVYGSGTPEEFLQFQEQFGNELALVCETPGNHDWKTKSESAATGKVPSGYEEFWSRFAPPRSKQPIAGARKGGARYEHVIDLEGWRFVFLDTGPVKDDKPWPQGDSERQRWLDEVLAATPGRSKIICAHHSRLSDGLHGDNLGVDPIWRRLFDAAGKPLVAFTLGGHDHNVSIYGPKTRDNPSGASVPLRDGVHVFVNGAGGDTFYEPGSGTPPDIVSDSMNFCVTRIKLVDARTAEVDTLSFGASPRLDVEPRVLPNSRIVLQV